MQVSTIVEPQLDFFNQYTAELHSIAEKLQNAEREHISEEIAILAAYCVKNMRIISEYDVVLCLTAFNVCNTYVKQHDRNPLFSYRFKRRIGTLIDAVICNMIHSIKFDFQTDNEMHVTLIQAGNIQFSFHMVPISRAEVDLVTKCGFALELPWDQIYKQNCARSLFLASLACYYNTNETFRGKDLAQKLNQQISNYRAGHLEFSEIFDF